MSWLDWLRRGRTTTSAPLDVEATLAAGLQSASAAKQAIARLKRERKATERERRALLAQAKRVAPSEVRKMARSSGGMPELAVYQVAEAMREANETGHDDTLRREQLAEVEARLDAINRAIERLDASVRQSRR